MNIKILASIILIGIPLFSTGQKKSSVINQNLSGQWRSVYSHTENEVGLKNYDALGTGGRLNYAIDFRDNWTFSLGLYSSFNLGISDLQQPDPITGKLSRYEEGLFNRLDLDQSPVALLGESYVSYKSGFNSVKVGRFKVNTPFINPQDGRMIPTLVQGAWVQSANNGKIRMQAGVLNRIAPRSTGTFMKIGESIGTYPTGRDIWGNPSKYSGNTRSDFIGILNTDWFISKALALEFWNYYVDNIFNTFYLKPKWSLGKRFGLDAEWLHQIKIGDGGNSVPEFQYFSENQSDVIGFQIWQASGNSKVQLGYNRIFPGGRFLFPREWGREYLFSFQKLERSEGAADNHALLFSYTRPIILIPDKIKLRPTLSAGRHWKASVLDAADNKYSFPDYTHINIDIYVDFLKLPNLKPEILLGYKDANGIFPDNALFVINKVNLFHLSLFLNYNF